MRETLEKYSRATCISHLDHTMEEIAEQVIDDIVKRLKVAARYSGNGLPELQETLGILFQETIRVVCDDDETVIVSRGLTDQ